MERIVSEMEKRLDAGIKEIGQEQHPGSVRSGYLGELKGQGDLRLYFLVRIYPMMAIPLIMFLYYDPSHRAVLHPLC